MGKPEKICKKWCQNRPKEVRIQEVKTVLDAYFPNQWEWKAGSHIVVRHELLKKFPGFQPYGEFAVPVKKGQKVKRYYLKAILTAIEIIRELEDK